MVYDCAIVLYMNAMEKYELQTVYADGTVIPPVISVKPMKDTSDYSVRKVLLSERAQLAPGKSLWVKVKVELPSLQGISPDVYMHWEIANISCNRKYTQNPDVIPDVHYVLVRFPILEISFNSSAALQGTISYNCSFIDYVRIC